MNTHHVLNTVLIVLCTVADTSAQQSHKDDIINNPDAYAWQVFTEINHPADLSKPRGTPDATKNIGDDGVVVWQTWMRTDEVFLDKGERPRDWEQATKITPFTAVPIIQRRFRSPRKIDLDKPERLTFKLLEATEPPPDELGESAMNRPAFEFVVTNQLYNIEGQEAFHASGKVLNLPTEAREIKSAWKLLDKRGTEDITAEEIAHLKATYHTTTLQHQGKTYLYGLTALHLTTKDLPNWLWATFEHVGNPAAELPDNDRAGIPEALKATKWANYRLRGTQTDFSDSAGQPTILANTQIETGFQQTSSCITCHSRATIGDPMALVPNQPKTANRLQFFDRYRILIRHTLKDTADQVIRYGKIGAADPDWFNENRTRRRYTQLDFMWSLRNAKSKSGSP